MGFGGAVSAMLTSLKNNKRPRASAFKKLKGYQNVKYREGKIEKKATPQQLKDIRDKIRKEQREENFIFYIIIITFLAVLYILINFVRF